MKISFAITVCNELEEIKRLVPFLLENKRIGDEIVILYDNKNGNPEVLDFLLPYNKLPNVQTWRGIDFENNFANWKNKLTEYCTGDYIVQLDADEMISKYIVQNINVIAGMNPDVDLFFLPRINTVEGLTTEHINKWGWDVNEQGYVNFPDIQGRVYKSHLRWTGKVHEQIIGSKKYSMLPEDFVYCIQHHKTIDRQEKQNNYYDTL
jgi:hypothetical protein